jgi:hypothetical protein
MRSTQAQGAPYARAVPLRPELSAEHGVTLVETADVVLGLIANNNVRVYHPVTRPNWNDPDSCTNAAGTMPNVTIDAAILALTHSFVVDNFRCGAVLGKLNVTGAIAQKFRGAVATTKPTGYTKNYVYDDRLKYAARRTSSTRSRPPGGSTGATSRCRPRSSG